MGRLKIKEVAILNEDNPEFFEEIMKHGVDAVGPEMEKQLKKLVIEKTAELKWIIQYNSCPGSHTFHMCPECNKKGCRRYKCNDCIKKELKQIKERFAPQEKHDE